jgi:GntR family transcriptional regulator
MGDARPPQDLPVDLRKDSGIPLYLQVREQIRLLIHQGILKPGAPVPTVRGLAVQLGINANTVARIYRELEEEGLLDLRRGLGTFVAEGEQVRPARPRDLRKLEAWVRDLVSLARDSGLGAVELYQMIERYWTDFDGRREPGGSEKRRS